MSKKLLSIFLVLLTMLTIAPVSVFAEETEYAIFPMDVLHIVRTNTKLDADQKEIADKTGGHVKYAFDLSGKDTTVVAPFTGKILFIDKGNSHAVFFQSINKVKLANGKTDYLTCVFLHDDNISNLKVGQVYKQGEYFYDQGTYGKGKKGTYDRHLHIEIAKGKVDISTKYSVEKNLTNIRSSKVGIQVHEALFLKSNVTRSKDYIVVVCQNNKKINLGWKTLSQVTFDTNGGSTANSKQYFVVGNEYGTLTTPKRTGYTFNGWYTKTAGGTKVTSATKATKGNKTYYAQWTASPTKDSFSLAFSGNGGTGSMSEMVVLKNKSIVLNKNVFKKTGYVFAGWTVQRKSDNKWFVTGKGWQSEASISKYKLTKKVYSDKSTFTCSSTLQNGSKKNDTFVFHAVWKTCTHKWDSGKVTKSATTVATGIKTYTCSICNKTKTETIAKVTTEKYFSSVSASNISNKDAKITGKIGKTVYMKSAGFYIGTSKDSLKKITKNLKGKSDAAGNFNTIYYTLSEWYGKLQQNTTYYYAMFYVDKNGNECISTIRSFKTSKLDAWSKVGVSNKTETNAKIKGTVTFSKSINQSKCGFYLGTSKDNLKKCSKYDTINAKRTTTNMSYDLNKYGQKLKAGTTYYYQFYVVTSEGEFKSNIYSFKTSAASTSSSVTPTKLVFPLPTSGKVWEASTYTNHGYSATLKDKNGTLTKPNKSAYCSIDINLTTGEDKGTPVYAVATGKVIYYDASNGQIVLQHDTKLVTTNGKTYKKWYSVYAHMTNITVKKGSTVKAGQQIGKVGSVGKGVTGPHLHFSMASGNDGYGWYQKVDLNKAISPYYVYGFVNSNGSKTSYLKFKNSTAMTNSIINFKPTGK